MTATPACTATFSRVDGTMSAAFEREFDHTVGEVWRALTDPALLPQWLAPGEIELRLGGAVKLDFKDSGIAIDSTVTAFAEGRLLEYSWGGPGDPPRPVRWVLEPDGDGCRLTLRITVPAEEDVGRSAAGWPPRTSRHRPEIGPRAPVRATPEGEEWCRLGDSNT